MPRGDTGRLMLSEVRMDHGPIVDAGRNSGDLMMNLGSNIQRPRRLCEAPVPPTVPACAEYFNQEPVRTLADFDRIVLGGAR
jgi:hypothetical protein